MNPEETPLEPTPTEDPTPVESSPSSETVELQLVNEKLDTIVTEMTKEPTPEELEAQQAEQQAQQQASQSYEETTLENSATELELLQQISDKLTTLETISTEQQAERLIHYDNLHQMNIEQTWTLVFALAICIGFKIVMDKMTSW